MTNMSDRDRKLLMGLVPIVILAVFWFLLFSPKRQEAATAKTELAKQQERLDAAKATVAQANGAKTSFAADYGQIVRLGKAIPAQVDMPSLLLQLDGAARGTGIKFTKITAGARESVVAPATTPPAASAGSDTSSGAAGGGRRGDGAERARWRDRGGEQRRGDEQHAGRGSVRGRSGRRADLHVHA